MRILILLPLAFLMASVTAAPVLLPPTPRLSVVDQPGLERVAPDEGRYNAGTVDPSRTPRVERTFVLSNDTGRPVIITTLRASCGCETLLLKRGKRTVSSATLLPGERVQVQMSVDMSHQPVGALSKMAWVYGPDAVTPLATLVVDLTVRRAVAFIPPSLDFGPTKVGERHSLPFTAVIDADILGRESFPPLLSDGLALQIRPQGKPQPITRDGRAAWTQSYLVTLILPPRAPAGPLAAILYFQSPRARLSGGSATVSGEAVGPVSVSPSPLLFGSVAGGKDRTRSVVLSANTAAPLQTLVVASACPYLALHLQPPSATGRGGDARRILDVTLRANAPAGALQAQILVSGPDGIHLALPILADVTPAR